MKALDAKEIIGQKIGMFTILDLQKRGKHYYCFYQCECGEKSWTPYHLIKNNKQKSCGCLYKENRIKRAEKALKERKKKDLIEGTSISSLTREKPIKSNTSGVIGVHLDKKRNKWVAQIKFRGKNYNLGRFNTIEEAAKARAEAKEKFHNQFLREKGLLKD